MQIEYRVANGDDYAAINEISKQMLRLHKEFRPEYRGVVEKDYDLETYTNEITDEDKRWIVACADGEVCGAMLVYITAGSSGRIYGYVDLLYVYPEFRAMGIASHLFSLAEDFLRKNDIHSIELNVWAGNDAFDFYQKQGMSIQRYFLKKEI